MDRESRFLYHTPCEQCGSSDAKAVYSNGTAFCFSCETFFRNVEEGGMNTSQRMRRQRAIGLIDNLEYKPLKVRRISEETCRKFGYGYGKYRNDIVQVAPYYYKGEQVAHHIRTPNKEFAWAGDAKNLELFGQHLWNKGGKRLVVTEGEIDCLTVAQVFNLRWPVVSVPNGAQSAKKYIKQNLEWVESFEEVVLSFDNDEQGQKAAEECAMLLTPGKVKIANWNPYKDPNEMLQDGKGSKIAEVIFQAKQYRPDGIVPGSELSLESLIAEEDYMSYDLPYPRLNSMLRGIRKAEITTLTAGSGIGKSTFAREIGFHLVTAHNLRVGIIALEESIRKSAIGYMALRLNVPMGELFLNKNMVPREDFEAAYNELIAPDRLFFYDHFGSLESDNLVNKMRFLAQGLNVDFIILDHISIVVSGIEDGDERRIIDNLMTSLRSLVENTGVGMILISHLSVPQGKALPHEEGGRVTLNQLRGSGSIKQLSDNIIGLERNQQGEDPDVSQVRLLKNRLFGETGIADTVRYHRNTGRLLEDSDDDEPDGCIEEEFVTTEEDMNDIVPF